MLTKKQIEKLSDDRLIGYHDCLSDAMEIVRDPATADALSECNIEVQDVLIARGLTEFVPDYADLVANELV